jgi:hypothetical protein
MKQSRLEALKLAVSLGGEYDTVMLRAEEMAQYIEGGPKVIEIATPKPKTPLQKNERKRRKSRY